MRGIGLMVGAMLGFAVNDALVKAMLSYLPIGQIFFAMGIGGVVIFGMIAARQGLSLLSRAFFARSVMVRNISEVVGSLGFVTSLQFIPLSTASVILQATPLVVTLGASFYFRETIGWRRWCAVGVGFAGVLIIIRPGLDGFQPAALITVVGVVGLAMRDLATRAVPRDIGAVVLSAYGFFMLVPTGVILLTLFDPPVPFPMISVWMLAASMAAAPLAYYGVTAAMRTGDVGAVTPFRYTRLIFAMAIGILFFREKPDALTWAGAAMIMGSGLYTYMRERRLAKIQSALST